MISFLVCLAIIGVAIWLLFRHGFPRSFPWRWAGLFSTALLVGSLSPLGTIERWFLFTVLLAAFVIGCRIPRRILKPVMIGAGILLAAFVAADALRIIPTPDVMVTDGEQLLGGLIRRPYVLTHPNLAAAWSLLLPFGAWTVITILFTQSRGALIGILPALVMRFIPRRYMIPAIAAGALLFGGALALRPGTALDRLNFWTEGARLFAARPLMGWGSGSYRSSLLNPGAAAAMMNAVTQRTGMHTAHNALITIAAENGLMGLIPFAGLGLGVFSYARRSSSPLKWSVLAFAIQQCFDDQWLHPITSIIIGLSLAMLQESS